MMGTIQKFYHIFLVPKSMIYFHMLKILDVSEQMSMNLMGTNGGFGCGRENSD